MAMNRVTDHIFIGSYHSLAGQRGLQNNNITHILSLLRGDIPDGAKYGFKHLHIQVDDDDEEDIMKFFGQTNEFIQDAVLANEGVLVHCMAGISRSVTVACAYIMKSQNLTPDEAIALVKEKRSVANPNPSFREQLQIYYDSDFEISMEKPLYRQWILKKQAEGIPLTGVPPNLSKFFSETSQIGFPGVFKINKTSAEAPANQQQSSNITPTQISELRCKRCRSALASSRSFIIHTPASSGSSTNLAPRNGLAIDSSLAPSCMQYFLEPIGWMKPELEKGNLEGKFLCPKCSSKLGSYSWQGNKCSCGKWVIPAIEVHRARVDEVKLHI